MPPMALSAPGGAEVVDLAAERAARAARSAERLAECWSILGAEYDPLRVVWDEQATAKDRRLLLAMAGQVQTMAARLAGRQWCDLLPETRAAIAGALRRWRGWAERLQ